MEDDLKDFIDKRINSNYYKLRNAEDWRTTNENYKISYEKLHRRLPKELQESAKVDGATDIKTFFKIILPISKPIILVLVLYAFVAQWNSYFDAMIYLKSDNLAPMQLVLRRILIQNQPMPGMISDQLAMAELKRLSEMIKYSAIVISSLPLMIMYPFFQKYFEQGVMVGSIKG